MTPQERAAMQQALEALEELHYSSGTVVAARMYESATAALREALANPEERGTSRYEGWVEVAEQAEQEPVAYAGMLDGSVCAVYTQWPVSHYHKIKPLYAAPVRTKDLTDDEINKISGAIANAMPANMTVEDWKRSFARAVIAADREKNK